MGGMGGQQMGMGGMGTMGGKGGARPGMMPGMMPGMQGGGMMRPMMMGGKGMGGMGPAMGGKGAPMQQQRPMMQQQMQRPGGMMPPQQMMAGQQPRAEMSASNLANAPPGMQKQMLGEKIFPLIARLQPEMAGKITGMMLEMDNSELLILLESPEQLKMKVDEALRVLEGGR